MERRYHTHIAWGINRLAALGYTVYTRLTYTRVFTIDITSIYFYTRKHIYCIIINKVLLIDIVRRSVYQPGFYQRVFFTFGGVMREARAR